MPTKPTALSILLEKMVVEVALPKDRQLGRYPSFHPKTWVLAYVNADGDKKYRFVVMSRNLTFDRSWDISFAMDSSKNVRQKKKTQPICDFLDYLVMNVHNTSNNAGKKRNLIRGLCADIKDVSFSLDSKIFGEDFEVLPLGIGKNAYRMQEDILFCKERGNANSTFNELVVMSPFLSESVIADFNLTDRALSDCKRTLVTRRSELGKLKASDVDNFTIYALKDEIIDGEEEISDELADKKKQDIHAKIYLRRKYSDVDLYLGSMNASYSAINKNVEMMLWLGTKNMYLNGDKFLEDIFCGPVGDAKNPFEQVTVADAVLETESDNRNLLEQKIKDLCRVKRQAVISEDNENAGKYKIEVEFSGIESDSEVTVSPFNSKQEQTLSEHIEFSELEILSATPYKLYSTLEEIDENQLDEHYAEFFQVMNFLFDDEVKDIKFKEVWKNYSHALSELKAGDSAIIRMKELAENAMYQGVSRTERISVMDSGDYTDDSSVKHHLQIDENDINSYIQMSRLLSKTDSNHSLPVDYAKSCPYLMSFMKKYKIKEQIEKYYIKHPDEFGSEREQCLLWLNRNKINKYDELPKTNARLEALKEKAFTGGAEKYLWIPPSLPYYEMQGAYKNSKGFSKILVFSAWEMVPRMIGALVSYEAERLTVGKLVHQIKNQDKKNTGYFADGSRRYPVARLRFNVSNGEVRGMSLFALLYPSKTLSDMYLPIESLNNHESLEVIEKSVRLKLKEKLAIIEEK